MARTLSARGLVSDEGQAVLQVVQRYSRAWRWLLAYDEDRLVPAAAEADGLPEALGLAEAQRAIATLRADLAGCGEATPLFGQDNRQALAGILGAIEQTFDGQPLYPTAQLRAAHLLYFVIKDHPFADGNKRIGTLLFLEFLRRNQGLLKKGSAGWIQTLRTSGALTAQTLGYTAASEPAISSFHMFLRLIQWQRGHC